MSSNTFVRICGQIVIFVHQHGQRYRSDLGTGKRQLVNRRRSALFQHISPLGWEHVNLTGDYIWHTNKRVANGRLVMLPSNSPVFIRAR
jgi:hypothetical protein